MQFIEVLESGGVAEVVLDRPKVNAMSQAVLREMVDVFRRLAEDGAVRGVLVRGAGKCLSAGLDLREVASLDRARLAGFLDDFDAAFGAAFRFPKPFAAAVHGHALAGGAVLAMCADYIALGDGDSKFGLPELVVGIPFPRVAFEIVRAACPTRAFRRLVFGADSHSPAEVFEMGVGDSLSKEPLEDARRWLATACSRPAAAFRFVKASHRKEAWERIAAPLPEEREAFVEALLSAKQAFSAPLAG
ncbi:MULTISPECIES: enoyl-CoA hydratase/isomerase family protein [Sorangium]|uniref:Enoyl-CoA hydratase n=1 Tax=Sorangium cellulosum TaxID=56 RepID=A0A4P2QYM1_SORCE|nr:MULTISPECIES: enoyl-CoA hydratase/isomerase family protein [Sorangium]AUX35700.1 enoyl-CoA hydratase [Sorangium cellulosum]WCQ94999.1 putative enoyl-CoA hydratase echA17 [Sorangium sp. Soce836]